MQPLAIDLFCGLGGWTEGLMQEGYYVVGFDIERHIYGEHRYPAQLVIQDVLTLDGRQFRDAALIVVGSCINSLVIIASFEVRHNFIVNNILGSYIWNCSFKSRANFNSHLFVINGYQQKNAIIGLLISNTPTSKRSICNFFD